MKKRNTIVMAGVLALALLASCKKENNTNQNLNGSDLMRANIEQSADGSRTHVNGTTGEVGWNEGDEFLVVDSEGTSYTFSLVSGQSSASQPNFHCYGSDNMTSPFAAVYPAAGNSISNNTATITLPATQAYAPGSFANGTNVMVGYQTSSEREVNFKNVLGGVCFSMKGDNVVVTRVVLTSSNTNDRLSGTFTVNCTSDTPELAYLSDGGNSITLNCGAGVTLSNDTSTDFYFMVPPGTLESGFTVEAYTGTVKVFETSTTTAHGQGFISRNSIKRADSEFVVAAIVPPGALQGTFTVNASGDKIYFSQGSLQYNPAHNIWRFAENQYDLLHRKEEGMYITVSDYQPDYDGWIELFGWGCTGQQDSQYNTEQSHFMPYEIETTGSLNSGDISYGPTGEHDLSIERGSDWGALPIDNGGNSGWRLWDIDEVLYIFNSRNIEIRWAMANVHGTEGIIIFPDDWDVSFYQLQYYHNFGLINDISDEDWANIFEPNGAMFMTQAGLRIGNTIVGAGEYGAYWSRNNAGEGYAWCPIGDDDYPDLNKQAVGRCIGGLVRLICDVVPNP